VTRCGSARRRRAEGWLDGPVVQMRSTHRRTPTNLTARTRTVRPCTDGQRATGHVDPSHDTRSCRPHRRWGS
jgi:hypothetical protein